MRTIAASAVGELVSRHLGLPPNFSSTTEGASEFARHIASFECPCSERHLKASLSRFLSDQAPRLDASHFDQCTKHAEVLIDGLLDHGDLIEVEDEADGHRVIALGAPAVCALSAERIAIIGVAPRGADVLPEKYRSNRLSRGFARLLAVLDSETVLNDLHTNGYVVITETEWRNLPNQTSAASHIASYTSRLRTDTAVGNVEGLRLLDSRKPVLHYKSRWIEKPQNDGNFIARRQRKFGNEGWAFVRIHNSQPTALVDLPSKNFPFRACDEAWHLQQAIDHEMGQPQRFQAVQGSEDSVEIRFFSPIPQWAHRRLSTLGDPVDALHCLFAYSFPTADIAQTEIKFLETKMWLAQL